jgi:hypothetical protein
VERDPPLGHEPAHVTGTHAHHLGRFLDPQQLPGLLHLELPPHRLSNCRTHAALGGAGPARAALAVSYWWRHRWRVVIASAMAAA